MDKLWVTKDTEWEDIYEFIESRIDNPIEVGSSTVYSFNNHKVNEDEIPELDDSIYVIPYGMATVWTEMVVTVIPLRLRYANMLRYNVEENDYHIANKFSYGLDRGYLRSLRGNLEEKI